MIYSPDKNRFSLILPARSEVIRKIEIKSNDDYVLIPNQRLSDHVYVARTLVDRRDPRIKIMNTHTEIVTLKNVKINSEKLSKYTIFDLNDYKNSDKTVVLEKLKKDFPKYAEKDLTDLCSQFLDIFALETDTISCNNLYKQKLRLKDDTPVFVKNYRIPKVHKDIIESKVTNMLKNGTIEPSMSE